MLASLGPEKLKNISQNKALRAFETASNRIPAYKQFLKDSNIQPSRIKSIDDFTKLVPLLDKESTFKLYCHDIKKLCLDSELRDICTIVSSSGHSGCFSYGLSTPKEAERSQKAVDFVLDYIFDVSAKKTLLINCLPMGVRIHSGLVTVVDTSVRPDIAINVIKTFSRCYEQLIIIGENSFIKKLLEDGVEGGVDWKKLKTHLVLGEEILPENLRTYFADILGINLDSTDCPAIIGSSFGVAEFGLNIFYETKELIRIRRLLHRDRKLREKLIGKDLDNLPGLFYYNPMRVFVEEVPNKSGLSNIVITNLEEVTQIPLVRYNIGDEGICLSFQHLKDVLFNFGYSDYAPKIKLPLVAIWGRNKLMLNEGFYLRPEFVKELLYRDKNITSGITGNFRLSNSKAGLRIEIQAKKNLELNETFENKIRTILLQYIPAKTEIIIYPYREFPYGMELNYERKFQYIE